MIISIKLLYSKLLYRLYCNEGIMFLLKQEKIL